MQNFPSVITINPLRSPRNDSEPIEETMTRQAAVGQLNRMTLPGRWTFDEHFPAIIGLVSGTIYRDTPYLIWLVVEPTPLKNINQLGGKINQIIQTTNQ